MSQNCLLNKKRIINILIVGYAMLKDTNSFYIYEIENYLMQNLLVRA